MLIKDKHSCRARETASATIGTLPEGAKTGAAVKTIKLLAQSTGEFTRDELKKDVKLAWTDKTKSEIAAAKGSQEANQNENGGGTGTVTPGTGGDNGGNSGDNGGGGNDNHED